MEKLPEKCCVKRESHSWNIITEYFNKTYKGASYCGYSHEFPYVGNTEKHNNSLSKPHLGHTEITFDQFKKFVLGEEDTQEELEYWECIEDRWPYKILGLTCKIKNKKAETVICNVDGLYKAGTELFVSLNLEYFKPSTREAYEAQEKKEECKDCEDCEGKGTVMVSKLYPSGHTEVDEECPSCKGHGEKVIIKVNNVSQLNQKQNEHSKEDNTSKASNQEGKIIEVQGPDFGITSHPPIRGKGINHPNIKVSVGNGPVSIKGRVIEG